MWSSNLCRICSQICEVSVSIFDQSTPLGIDIKIKRCMSVVITKDDMKPQQICRPCLFKLNDFYNFISLFHDSNYKFENTLFQCSLQPLGGVVPVQDLDLDLSVVHNTVPECANINLLSIPVCLDNPANTQIINEIEQVHVEYAHNTAQNCNKTCVLGNNYYTLEPTPQTIVNRTKKSTLVSVPSIINDYKINYNDQAIAASKHRKPKIVINTKPGIFKCDKCSKVFSRKQRLTDHLLKHTDSRPFACELCGKTFAIKWDFTLHKRSHTSTLVCQICCKCFGAPSKLQRHMRTHTNERPFVCKVANCGMAFSDKRNLVGHQVTHTDVRNFKCSVCKRFYKTKSQLNEHIKAHSDKPSFRCLFCDKCFKWRANLYIHNAKVHNGPGNVKNKVKSKAFEQKMKFEECIKS